MSATIALSIILVVITVWCGLASFNRGAGGTIVRNFHTTVIMMMSLVQYSYVVLAEGQWPTRYLLYVVLSSLGLFIGLSWGKTWWLRPRRLKHTPLPQKPPLPVMPERKWFQQ